MRIPALVAVRIVAPRAIIIWGLSRLLYAALPLAVGGEFGSMAPSPGGVVLLAGLLGVIDIQVRKERMLWANLGVTLVAIHALYAAAAIPGELLLALL